MALNTNELYSDNTNTDRIRIQPHADGVAVCTVDGISGAPTLLQGLPMGQITATGLWVPWDVDAVDGSQIIAGFIWDHDGVATHATNEVQCNMMKAGVIHRDDVNTATMRALLPNTPTEGELDTALKATTLRQFGLIVQGLALVG